MRSAHCTSNNAELFLGLRTALWPLDLENGAARACLDSSCCIHTEPSASVCSNGRAKEDVKRLVSIKLKSLARYQQSLLQKRAEMGFAADMMAAIDNGRSLKRQVVRSLYVLPQQFYWNVKSVKQPIHFFFQSFTGTPADYLTSRRYLAFLPQTHREYSCDSAERFDS